MRRVLLHPTIDQFELSRVLTCLADGIRLAIVVRLFNEQSGSKELRCRAFSELGSKSNLTYHFDKLREAGLVTTRLEGAARYLRLRQEEVEGRFPGLLDAIVRAVNE